MVVSIYIPINSVGRLPFSHPLQHLLFVDLKHFLFQFMFGCAGSSLLHARAFSPVVASRGYSLVVVRGLLNAAASLVAVHRL